VAHRVSSTSLVWLTAFVAAGVASAIYFFLGGDPCVSSARIEWLYISPLLLGAAGIVPAARARSNWWFGIGAAVVIAAASAGLLVILVLIQWDANCYT
jgi:hypothetical protein